MLEEASRHPGSAVVFRAHREITQWRSRYPALRFMPVVTAARQLRGMACRVFFDHHVYDWNDGDASYWDKLRQAEMAAALARNRGEKL